MNANNPLVVSTLLFDKLLSMGKKGNNLLILWLWVQRNKSRNGQRNHVPYSRIAKIINLTEKQVALSVEQLIKLKCLRARKSTTVNILGFEDPAEKEAELKQKEIDEALYGQQREETINPAMQAFEKDAAELAQKQVQSGAPKTLLARFCK